MAVTGVWRSLVARSAGGREVASSNLATPMKLNSGKPEKGLFRSFLFASETFISIDPASAQAVIDRFVNLPLVSLVN